MTAIEYFAVIDRDTLQAAAARACERIAPTWPLDRLIAVSPLWERRQQRWDAAALARLPPHTLMQRAGLAVYRLGRALVPHARHVHLPQATHMVAGDDNDAFTATVLEYLASLSAAPGNAESDVTESVSGATP